MSRPIPPHPAHDAESVVVAWSWLALRDPSDRSTRVALADALLHLAARQDEEGFGSYARAAAGRAADIFRDLAPDAPATYLPRLGAALDLVALYHRQSGYGKRIAALAEAAAAHREAAADPTHLPAAVAAGNRLVAALDSADPDRSSAEPLRGHAALLRRVLAAEPNAEPTGPALAGDLLRTLTLLIRCLTDDGSPTDYFSPTDDWHPEAVAAGREAMTLWRGGAGGVDPEMFAETLATLAERLDRTESPDTVTVQADTVTVYETLAATDPAAYAGNRYLAASKLSRLHREQGRPDEALDAARRALAAARQLDLDKRPNWLGWALEDLGSRLVDLHRHAQALPVFEEGVLHARNRMSPWFLAVMLDRIRACHKATGRYADAHTAALEAVAIFRTLAASEPGTRPGLATALQNLGTAMDDLGRHQEALAATTEAVDLPGSPPDV